MADGQPCLLWLSGRDRPGVHALGALAAPPAPGDAGPVVPMRLTLLAEPVGRGELLVDPAGRGSEVLRMPAGSNPSWLTREQYEAVRALVHPADRLAALGPWSA
jgi:hypothetical protein